MFLVLATPLGESLVPHLMVITADLSRACLKSAVSRFFETVSTSACPVANSSSPMCAAACAISCGIMISLLYGYLTYTSFRKRSSCVMSAAVILIFTNGVRAYIVMAVASATNMQYLGGRDHIYFGWLMFGVVMMLIMWFGARYADEEEPRARYVTCRRDRAPRTALPLIGALGLIMLAVTLKPLQKDFGETGAMIASPWRLSSSSFLLLRHKTRGDRSDSRHPERLPFISTEDGR